MTGLERTRAAGDYNLAASIMADTLLRARGDMRL
jgi:hypothetical protein